MNVLTSIFGILKSIYLFYFKVFYLPLDIVFSSDTAYFLSVYLHILVLLTFLFSALISGERFRDELYNFSLHIVSFIMTALFVFSIADFKSLEEFTFGGFFFVFSACYAVLNMRHNIYIVERGNDLSRHNSYEEDNDYYDYEEHLEHEIEELKREIRSLKKEKSES